MATLLFLAGLITILAAMGRIAIPQRERLPLRQWNARDVFANASRGAMLITSQRTRLDDVLDQPRADSPRDPVQCPDGRAES